MTEPNHTSRRSFLKRSGGIVAATTLGAHLGVARSAHASGSDMIKLGLIGCGKRGRGAVADCLAADKNIKLVAVADAFEDMITPGIRILSQARPGQVDVKPDRIFVGLDAYRKVLASDVDLVLLASPPGFRPYHYRAAVEAGKHIFMEKPCCVDAPGYRSLLESNKLAEEKNLKVGVGFQRRHQQHYREIVERIRNGQFGDIQFFRAYFNTAGVWSRPRTPDQTEMEYQIRNWYYFVWLSGDHIVEQHVHNLDVANWIRGAHPVEAQGMGGREVRKFGPRGDFGHIYDHHSVEFTYADGTKLFSQCRHIPGCWQTASEHTHTAQGYVSTDERGYMIYGPDGKRISRSRAKGRRSYDQEHVDLIDAIRNDKKYLEGPIGAEASLSAILGRMATYSGNVVRWDEAAADGPSEMPKEFAWNAAPPVLPDKEGSYEHAVAMPGRYKAY
ncbi:MAG TPA: Gfo/Idh/MocA family oxidoreductase [Thermoguttaceae bacterium]|nr:Gfo/Idh/MocA family oxidoreductase [Thermoguttaceae bacterium]